MDLATTMIILILMLCGMVFSVPYITHAFSKRKHRKAFIDNFGHDPLAINPQLKNLLTNTINEVLVKLAKERDGAEEAQRIFLKDVASSSRPYSDNLETCRLKLKKAVLAEKVKFYKAYDAALYFRYDVYPYETALLATK